MEIRLTAQLVISDTRAILAYSIGLEDRGPCGETHGAVLLQTSDAGNSWSRVALRRTMFDHISHLGCPTWPPEAVLELTHDATRIQFVFRDEWVPYERMAGESLWRAVQRRNGKWSTSRIRYMKYETTDSPVCIDEIELDLPACIKEPAEDVLESGLAGC